MIFYMNGFMNCFDSLLLINSKEEIYLVHVFFDDVLESNHE